MMSGAHFRCACFSHVMETSRYLVVPKKPLDTVTVGLRAGMHAWWTGGALSVGENRGWPTTGLPVRDVAADGPTGRRHCCTVFTIRGESFLAPT